MSCASKSYSPSKTSNSSSLSDKEIQRHVNRDAASLVLWLMADGFKLDSPSEEYDSEDYKYHNEYCDDQAAVNDECFS